MRIFRAFYMAFWRKNVVNRIVLVMIYSDFLMFSGSGFLSPIVAVFITGQIKGATLSTVGFATTIFWVVKSAAQVPISMAADARKGERDDFQFMVLGSLMSCITPLLYYFFAREAWQIYVLQAWDGLASALAVPTWLAIFGRHLDKRKESTEWALHSNAVGVGYAATAAIGGVLAERFGFRVVFLLVSAFMFLGTVTLLAIRDDIIESDGKDGGNEFGMRQNPQRM